MAGPILTGHFESSVEGLFFAGLPAALSFGPLLRFVAGAAYNARQVNRRLAVLAREGAVVGMPAGALLSGGRGAASGAAAGEQGAWPAKPAA